MNLSPIDWLIVVAYFFGIVVLGVWLGRRVKSQRDLFLGGRSLPFWAIGLSIVGSDIGASDFVGLVGATYENGLVMANMDWIGSMPALILAGFVFVPYYWRAGVYSVPEFLGLRYGQTVRAIQTLVWTVYLATNLGVMLWSTGIIVDELAGIGRWNVILLAAALTGGYTITGGLAAVVYSDAIQVTLMLLGGALVVWLGLSELAERAGTDAFTALYEGVTSRGPEFANHFTLYLSPDSGSGYAWPSILFGLTFVLAPAYFIANQAIVQRTLGAKDEWNAKAGALFGCFFKFLVPFVVVGPGLIAAALYTDVADGEADAVFARLVADLLPVGVRGVVVAAFLAGLMSSVDSALNSSATLFTRDFLVGFGKIRGDDRSLLVTGRMVTLGILVLAVATAPLTELFAGVYAALQSLLSIVQGPSLGLLLPGMFSRRVTGRGGLAALVAGLSVSLGLTVHHKLAVDSRFFHADEPFFAIAGISFLVTVAVNFVVSWFQSPPSAESLRGLVFRWAETDDDVQAALRRRAEGAGGEEA